MLVTTALLGVPRCAVKPVKRRCVAQVSRLLHGLAEFHWHPLSRVRGVAPPSLRRSFFAAVSSRDTGAAGVRASRAVVYPPSGDVLPTGYLTNCSAPVMIPLASHT